MFIKKLNFKDEPTQVILYSIKEISGFFEDNNCRAIESGTGRKKLFLLLTPFRCLPGLLGAQKLNENILRNALGFAEFVFTQKKTTK